MQALKAYKSVGMGFDDLVQLYGDIIAEIDNKKWALTELRHTDSNDLNDLWKWSFCVEIVNTLLSCIYTSSDLKEGHHPPC